MSSRREKKRAAAKSALTTPPADGQNPASVQVSPAVDPSIAERLARLEQSAPRPWSLEEDHRKSTVEPWLRANVRHDAAEPCPSCGLVGGEQRLRRQAHGLLPNSWVCPPCMDAMCGGWSTSTVTVYAAPEALERLAARAAGLDRGISGFLSHAGRYGLTLTLAHQHSGQVDGTAWSHLDRAAWAEAGQRAVDRLAAGWPLTPPLDFETVMAPKKVETFTFWDAEQGRSVMRTREVLDGEPPTAEELASQLRAEERAIEAALKERAKERVRAEKERQAKEQQEQRERAVHAHYAAHKAQLETQIRDARARLAAGLDAVLSEPNAGWCDTR